MKEILKSKKVLIGLVFITLFIISISATYAWFGLTVSGNEDAKQMTVETGTLSLVFKDGVKIEGINIRPGWSQTKTFTVTNTGTFDTSYNMIFKDLINEIERNELVVSYTCTSYTGYVDSSNKGTVSGTCNSLTEQVVPLSEGALSSTITENISIGLGITHEYTLTIEFIETNDNQNYNQGKDVNTKINIVQDINNLVPTRGNIYNVLLEDNPTIKNDSADLFADVADEVSESGLFRTTDLTKTEGGQEVLYFRGVVENNYMVFANYCWRIVRTNEGGESIKLRYGGQYNSADNTCPQTGSDVGITVNGTNKFTYSYNGNYSDLKYVKWVHEQGMDSNAKFVVESWYTQNIETQGSEVTSLIVDEAFCNDTTYEADPAGGALVEAIMFGPFYRIVRPQYNCPQESDKYSVSRGNISKPVALLTADEVAYAGGKFYSENINYYLYTGVGEVLISPSGGSSSSNSPSYRMSFISPNGSLEDRDSDFAADSYLYRMVPALSISSDADIADGTGQYNDPYVVVN